MEMTPQAKKMLTISVVGIGVIGVIVLLVSASKKANAQTVATNYNQPANTGTTATTTPAPVVTQSADTHPLWMSSDQYTGKK